MFERKKLITAIAIGIAGIVSGLFWGGHFPISLPVGMRIFIVVAVALLSISAALKGEIMIVNERNRFVLSAEAVFLVGIVSGLFVGGDLMPSHVEQIMMAKRNANEVWALNFEFAPGSISVPVGTTVTWVNKDGEFHTVASDSGVFLGTLEVGGSFNYTFVEPGTFSYYCEPHSGMIGTIVVE